MKRKNANSKQSKRTQVRSSRIEPMNTKLSTIITAAAADLESLADEGEKQILDAMSKAAVEAALQETPPKFRLGLTITIDLQKNTQENKLAWSVRHSLSHTAPIEDPKQGKLALN